MTETRVEARRELVQAANRLILQRHTRRGRPWALARLLNQRQVQQAVFVLRQNPGAVTSATFYAAGFRPEPKS